jgi:hypothetical protein
MRGMPSLEKVAGIIWAECGGIQASASSVTSRDTFLHRLAIGLCVVNRGRQNLDWGDNHQTCAPAPSPTPTELALPNVYPKWAETKRAATAAMATASSPLDGRDTLFGAQLYVHTWTGPHTGMRLGGRFVQYYRAWDTRSTIRVRRREGIVTYTGPRAVWLSVHVDEAMRNRAMARAARSGIGH